ncbi:hypothetical protein N566_05970 [Streptomycetaceae bacterium MP113-05]|nr:hypothetical protein N566_05970 [Streptomycetaceae bacterium MP113-05]
MSTTRIPLARRVFNARRHVATLAALVGLLTFANLLVGPPAHAYPPAPPSAATARSYLAGLTVSSEGSMSGYDRDKFPHWSSQGNNCNTRETVLKRDGSGVSTGSDCYPTSGSWYSVYDGVWSYAPSDIDIDHVVPLAEAWRSGASGWSDSTREALANDLSISQLIAVTDNSNQSKSDRDPAEWLPPRSSYHCMYARMWVWVKHDWNMTVDSAEKSALSGILNGC